MAKRTRGGEAPQGGMSLSTRLTLIMTLALAAVMTGAAGALFKTASEQTIAAQEQTLIDAMKLTSSNQKGPTEIRRLTTERDLLISIEKVIAGASPSNTELVQLRNQLRTMSSDRTAKIGDLQQSITWHQVATQSAEDLDEGRVKRIPIEIGSEKKPAYLLRAPQGPDAPDFEVRVSPPTEQARQALLLVIIGITVVVIVVGALVSVIVASQATRPIKLIAEDVWQISTGDLSHRTRARGVREVNLLARSIDRMTTDLATAQETKLALSVREREVALAAEVRESLLANATPVSEGFEFGALCLSAVDMGGDFYDFIKAPGGEIGLLVCDVSGRGLPGTLIGATARAYLRAELNRGGDIREALFHVNRELAGDVRRGMYVSALYVLLDPKTNVARVACAGHKLPLAHLVAATGKVQLVQPEGIALGFDKGPIFESRLELAHLKLEPGDRLAIFNSGPAVLQNPAGEEYGEKHIYSQVQRHGARATPEFLDRLRSVLEAYAAGAPLARDISILTARKT